MRTAITIAVLFALLLCLSHAATAQEWSCKNGQCRIVNPAPAYVPATANVTVRVAAPHPSYRCRTVVRAQRPYSVRAACGCVNCCCKRCKCGRR